jgi:hypothetical protein
VANAQQHTNHPRLQLFLTTPANAQHPAGQVLRTALQPWIPPAQVIRSFVHAESAGFNRRNCDGCKRIVEPINILIGPHAVSRFAAPPFHELKKQQMKTDGRHCAKADCFVARRALGIASQCSAPPRSRSRSVKRQRATRRRSAPSLTRGRSDATQDSVVRPPSDQTKSGLR